MNSGIKLSIVIPTYNYGRFIRGAIESVVRQDHPVYEIIVVDDGSTDATKSVVENCAEEFCLTTLRYYYQPNLGVSAARNHGAHRARGDYLWMLDADDQLLPGAVATIINTIALNPRIDMWFGGYRAVSHAGKVSQRLPTVLPPNPMDSVTALLRDELIGLRCSSAVIKRTVFDQLEFPTDIYVDEDTVFFAQILAQYSCQSIPQVLVNMPRHTDSLRENYEKIRLTGIKGVRELFSLLPGNQEMKNLECSVLLSRLLKVARMACIRHDYLTAAEYYRQAFKISPQALINLKHFPRLIKSLLLGFYLQSKTQKAMVDYQP